MKAKLGTPVAYALLELKKSLLANNHGNGLVMDTPSFGAAMERNTRAFQRAKGLAADGEIGPHTAGALFDRSFTRYEQFYEVPGRFVCKGCHLESAVDPGAVGYADVHDLGIMQINTVTHPSLTEAQLFDAEWSLDYYARTLRSQMDTLKDWDAAVASWNVGGGGAKAWLGAGKPATLFEPWFLDPDGDPLDLGARATKYVGLVKAQSC